MVTWHGVPPRSQSSASSARRSSPASADDQADGEDAGCSEEKALRDAGETAEQAEAELVPGVPDTADSGHRRAERLRADLLMVDAVLKEGLGGPRHRYLEDHLIAYAVPVLLSLLYDGRLVSKATQLGRPPVPADAWERFTPDDRAEFVQEMVAAALPRFTKVVFEDRRWSPDLGASLKTYFVSACILNFARLQAQWLDDQRSVRPVGLELSPGSFPGAPDPAVTVAARDEASRLLRSIPDERLQQVVALRAVGFTAEDAAREAGLTPKAAEGRLARFRKEIREQQADAEPHAGKRPETAQGGQ